MNFIEEFINIQNYKNLDNFIGIILYGSFQNKLNSKGSDIDLIVVFESKTRKEYKGYKTIKSKLNQTQKIEYFERNLESLYKRIEKDILNYEDSSLSIIGYGKILIDKNNKIKELQKYTKKEFKNKWPLKIKTSTKNYYLMDLYKSIEYLKRLLEDNDPYFIIYYGITLNKIRVFYNQLYGYSRIGLSKVYKIYNNPAIAKKQHRILPNKKFIKLFNACVETNDNYIRYKNIYVLFQYIIKDHKINFNNIKINLEGKEY